MLIFGCLFLCQIISVTLVNCNNLVVKTESGQVRGVSLRTLLNNREYIAYRGIPYAEPPIGNLRFKVPVPITPWRGVLNATDYGNSCLVLAQSQLFPLNSTQSEDCLYLNVFVPKGQSNTINFEKAVMYFIHGGAFTEGDGSNGFYGPDFIVEDDVILVTFNYRLGPWGFASFDIKGFTGNMGFKDQQLALEWIKRNIKYFGGDPNLITVFGESAGGVAVHLQMLSSRSRKCMKRAIAMSGSAFTTFAQYQPNNHVELFKKTFGLDAKATRNDVLQYMLNAPVDEILEKTPVLSLDRSMVYLYFAAVKEDVRKAESPFLTRNPRDIYKTTNVNVDAMFGVTSAEYIVLFNPADRYSWIGPMKNRSNIGLPFSGLTLSPESREYRQAAEKIYQFYFGNRELLPTLENLNIYLKMNTDTVFVYAAHDSLKIHSRQAKTFCYENNLELNLNAIKISNNLQDVNGTAHFEDLQYLFRSKKYAQLYKDVLENKDDPKNKKTLEAVQFVTKMFTDYAKTGYPSKKLESYRDGFNNCIHITNDGLKPMLGLRLDAMKFWDEIRNSVKKWIVNPF